MPRICRTCDGSSVWRTSNAYNIYDSYMNHPQVVWGGYTIRCFFKIQVSFSVYRLFYRALLRGKPYNFERHTYNWAYVWKITHMSKLCHTSDWVTSQPSNNYVCIYIYIYIYMYRLVYYRIPFADFATGAFLELVTAVVSVSPVTCKV